MKIKEKIKEVKYYLEILTDFSKLNKYIYLSSILINRVGIILNNNLDNENKLNNLDLIYSDFKIDYDFEEFKEKIKVENKFESEEL